MAVASDSHIRHIVLIGPPGIGKTTLVVKICKALSLNNVPLQGFYTEEVLEKASRIGFDCVTLDGQRAPLARASEEEVDEHTHNYKREYKVGKYVVNVPSFENTAITSLRCLDLEGQPDPVYVIDEIGKMELMSSHFQNAVKEVLQRPNATVLCSIPMSKGRPIQLIEDIKSSIHTKVIYVTRINRDTLLKQIVEMLFHSYRRNFEEPESEET